MDEFICINSVYYEKPVGQKKIKFVDKILNGVK